jgi:hypothetical protein
MGAAEKPWYESEYDRLDAVAKALVDADFLYDPFVAPDGVLKISMVDSEYCAIVDAADSAMVSAHRWRVTRYPRGFFSYPAMKGRGHALHRWLAGAQRGQIFDHANRIVLDSRRTNIRPASLAQNAWNKVRRKHEWNSSIYVGVSLNHKGWDARIRCNGVLYKLGLFASEIDAARAYDAKCLELRGEFAVLNFPELP